MKSEEEVRIILGQAVNNAVRSESIEQLRFYQGQINMIELILGLNQDAFSEDKEEEKNG